MHDQNPSTESVESDNEALLKYLRSASALGGLTQDEILLLLSNTDPEVRIEALRASRLFGRALAAAAGRCCISESIPLVRMAAVELLGEFGSQELDTHRLVNALHDQSWIVRSSAALALGCIGGPAAFERLTAMLEHDPHEAVRRDIGHAVAEFGTKAIPAIESALRSEKSRITRCGLLSGYYNVTGEGLMHLMALLADTDVMVRSNAINCWMWEEIKPSDCQKVIAALTMLVGTDENACNIYDAKLRLSEYAELQKLEDAPEAETVTESTPTLILVEVPISESEPVSGPAPTLTLVKTAAPEPATVQEIEDEVLEELPRFETTGDAAELELVDSDSEQSQPEETELPRLDKAA